ncbi:sugar phosphate isomerase/epimerase family protein [Mucilaginibacter ginkgonis]|uniref:Sugar phosphate isomerase/epimerase n=1 Tax=Mucilaginibacter ginkgonis TaxID=2682091 RepID=A0A6I4IPB4_9SPHI|nr:sugar phosphate isomerase/epimerase [Mucilaginibacter ginkgonis]QQL50691.1 sugar phosphate isomerase/epimerase [Mucilaginibacter ginkgonis]
MTTRRQFLSNAGLLTAGAFLAPHMASAKINAKAGIQLYTLREQLPKDPKGVIAKVAQAGYKEVETFGYSKANGFWGLSASEFSQTLKANGLTTCSGHYGTGVETGNMAMLDECIEAAKVTGQEYVIIPYLGDQYRKTASDIKSFVEKVNKAAEHAKNAGVKLGYHNHNFEFTNVGGTTLADELLKGTSKANFSFEMDIYWVVRSGQDPIQWIKKYPGRFQLVHVKDMDKGQPELNTEIGKGSIDFKKIVAEAKLAGIQHYVVEQENFKIDPYISITESAKYIKNTLFA